MKRIIELIRLVNRGMRYFGLLLVNKGGFREPIIRKLRIDYLRLKLTSLVVGSTNVKKLRALFLGYSWRFFDRKTFVSLVEEIFVENEYHSEVKIKNPFIIDLGSNIGLSVLYFKTLFPSSSVLAFEPDTKTFDCLKENVKGAKLKDVKLINAAVYDKEGKISFYVDKDGDGSPLMSTISERFPKQRIIVEAVKLSKYVNKKVDILKMDIEGAEMRVLSELDKSGSLKLVSEIFLEYHHHIHTSQDDLSLMFSLLEKNNFGYQISAGLKPPFERLKYEDILIYAYKKR
jgi:FkbM family methyltransferase